MGPGRDQHLLLTGGQAIRGEQAGDRRSQRWEAEGQVSGAREELGELDPVESDDGLGDGGRPRDCGARERDHLVGAAAIVSGHGIVGAGEAEQRDPADAIVRAWLGLQETAEESGIVRHPAETPTEFTSRSPELIPRFEWVSTR